MASITITIPDDKVSLILDAFASRFQYDPNGDMTKAEFAKSKLIEFLKRQYVEHMARLRAEEAEDFLVDVV